MNTSQITRGMQLAATRPEVMMDATSQRIQAIYEDIQQTLRVPIVNLIFRTLANDPDYFAPAWERTAPTARTRGFEAAADAIRAEALLEQEPDASQVGRDSTDPLEKIRAFNDTINYILPKLLLVVTAWDEGAWSGGRGDPSTVPRGRRRGRPARTPWSTWARHPNAPGSFCSAQKSAQTSRPGCGVKFLRWRCSAGEAGPERRCRRSSRDLCMTGH